MNNNFLEKEIWINAPIERVFACFTEEKAMLSWHGKAVELNPVPGGIYKVEFENGTTILGEYKEVLPPHRLVYTASYETVESEISIDFFPEKGGTRLTLKQVFQPVQDISSFDGGWDYFLGLLGERLGKGNRA